MHSERQMPRMAAASPGLPMDRASVLLTGATGFLGGAVLAHLLEDGVTPLLLVRATDARDGLHRVQASARQFSVSEDAIARLTPAHIICGDLTDVAGFASDLRLDRVTGVINCAALATFAENPNLWPVNVDGTFAFAKRMVRSPLLRRFVHVGTAMACGPGLAGAITESWAMPDRDEHLVSYTASKAEIEAKLRFELPELPLVVARPSIIVGHTRLGCAPSGSIFWVFRMAQALERFTCDLDEKIDVIPVDYCAEALVRLAFAEGLEHDLFHVSSGNESSCSFRDIEAALAAARGVSPMAPRYQKVTEDELESLAPRLEAALGPCNRRLVVRALRLYGGFAQLNYVFDNQRLQSIGLPQPPRLTDYVEVCAETSAHIRIQDQMHWDFK